MRLGQSPNTHAVCRTCGNDNVWETVLRCLNHPEDVKYHHDLVGKGGGVVFCWCVACNTYRGIEWRKK